MFIWFVGWLGLGHSRQVYDEMRADPHFSKVPLRDRIKAVL